jgi:hypothetical protein
VQNGREQVAGRVDPVEEFECGCELCGAWLAGEKGSEQVEGLARLSLRSLVRAGLLMAAIGAAGAQEAESSLQFEVASVKLSTPPTVDPHILAMRTPPDSPGRFTRRDTPLRTLIVMAYGLKPYEFAGPEWLTSARFDIMAKAGGRYAGAEDGDAAESAAGSVRAEGASRTERDDGLRIGDRQGRA